MPRERRRPKIKSERVMLDAINRLIEIQVDRENYPEDFPPLPEIPAGRYHDLKFAAAEIRMWDSTWLFVALESELPSHGSYVLFERLGKSVIIIRGKDGVVRAMHNVCRHRATTLLDAPRGKATRLVCPYHAWCYSADGELVAVPEAQDFAGLVKSTRGLTPIRCENWRSMIFINMNPDADSLASFMEPASERSADFPLEGLIVKDIFTLEMDCNWKLAYHNFLEAYHLNSVHPKTLGPHLDSKAFVISLFGNGHTRLAARKRVGKSSSIYQDSGKVPPDFGDLFRQYSITIPSFPNFSAALDACGFGVQTFWPLGSRRSIMEVRIVGWKDSPEDPEYWQQIRKGFDDIVDEDIGLFARMQKGVESGATNLLLGCQEKALYWFEEELDRRIGVENIPAGLRVNQSLAGQVVRTA